MEGYSCELPICRDGSRPARCFEESTCLKLIGDGGGLKLWDTYSISSTASFSPKDLFRILERDDHWHRFNL